MSDTGNPAKRRISLAFHEGLSFVRSSIADVLSVAAQRNPDKKLNSEMLRQKTPLGQNYAKAMPRYCQGAGLLDQKNELTAFGRHVYKHDPHLELAATLWLCHYNLAAAEGPGPEFWHLLTAKHLIVGDELRTAHLGNFLMQVYEQSGYSIAGRTSSTAASVFLTTYSRSDCLGGLGVLEAKEPGRYVVKDVESPPPLVFAYVIAEYWQRNLPNQTSVWIDEFNKSGGPSQVLLMGRGQVNQAMRELSRMGIATVQLTQPPYQFSPLWKSQDELLDRIYAT